MEGNGVVDYMGEWLFGWHFPSLEIPHIVLFWRGFSCLFELVFHRLLFLVL